MNNKFVSNSTRTPAVECPSCGYAGLNVVEVTADFVFAVDGKEVVLTATHQVDSCPSCGAEFAGADAERARHDAVCDYLGVLRPDDIRRLRSKYLQTRKEFAGLTGLGDSSIGRWESGALVQQTSIDRYLRLLSDPDNMQRLARLAAGDMSIGKLEPVTLVAEPRALEDVESVRRRGESFKLRVVTKEPAAAFA